MSKKIPDALKEQQAERRLETEKKIQEAIDSLKSLGYENITIATLTKETNLSRSTFNKTHVIEILKRNKIGKYREIKSILAESMSLSDKERIYELEKKLVNANIKIKKLEENLDKKSLELGQKKIELMEQKEQLQQVVGNFQALYNKITAMGIHIIL